MFQAADILESEKCISALIKERGKVCFLGALLFLFLFLFLFLSLFLLGIFLFVQRSPALLKETIHHDWVNHRNSPSVEVESGVLILTLP